MNVYTPLFLCLQAQEERTFRAGSAQPSTHTLGATTPLYASTISLSSFAHFAKRSMPFTSRSITVIVAACSGLTRKMSEQSLNDAESRYASRRYCNSSSVSSRETVSVSVSLACRAR